MTDRRFLDESWIGVQWPLSVLMSKVEELEWAWKGRKLNPDDYRELASILTRLDTLMISVRPNDDDMVQQMPERVPAIEGRPAVSVVVHGVPEDAAP